MKLSRTFEVSAPPNVAWDVTSDVEHWNQWTDTITSIEWVEGNSIEVGNRARIKQPMQRPAVWTVTDVVPGRSFRWVTSNMGARFVGIHEVEPGPVGSRATLGIEASGLGAIVMYPVLALALRRVLKTEEAGLTARCEARANPAP